jgi:hypothetical protein
MTATSPPAKAVDFTAEELAEILRSPEAVQVAIIYNDLQESLADSQGMDSCAAGHRARRYELNRIHEQLVEAQENGD